jgi:hypothetical protein
MKHAILYFITGLMLLGSVITKAQSARVHDYAMNDLRNAQLNVTSLVNYEEQAVQKLQDILDYMTIIGSTKYNESMRKTALETVLSDFDAHAKINCNWIEDLDESKSDKQLKEETPSCEPQKILNKLFAANYYEVQVVYEEVVIHNKLQKQVDGNYKGHLHFFQSIQSKKWETDEKFLKSLKKGFQMEFVLKRVKKKFGNEKEEVWEVKFLGMD